MWCLCSDASPVSGCTAVVCYQGAMHVASHTSEMNKVWCYSRKCAGFVLTAADVTRSTEPSHSSLVIDGDRLSAELSLTQGLNQINSWEKPPANSLAPYRQKLGPVNQASEVQVFPIMVSEADSLKFSLVRCFASEVLLLWEVLLLLEGLACLEWGWHAWQTPDVSSN